MMASYYLGPASNQRHVKHQVKFENPPQDSSTVCPCALSFKKSGKSHVECFENVNALNERVLLPLSAPSNHHHQGIQGPWVSQVLGYQEEPVWVIEASAESA